MRMTEKESMMQNEKKKRRLTRLVLTGICMAGCLVPMIGLAADTSSENDIRYGLHVTDSDAVNGKIDISFDKDKIINVSSTEGITIALALDNKESDVSLSSAGDLTLNSTNMTTDLSHSTMGIRENIVNGTTKSNVKGSLTIHAKSDNGSAYGWFRTDLDKNGSENVESHHVIQGNLTINAISSAASATGIKDTFEHGRGNFDVKGNTKITIGSSDRYTAEGIDTYANYGSENSYHLNHLEISGTDPSKPNHRAVSVTATGGSKNSLTVDNGTIADMAVKFNDSQGLFTVATDDNINNQSTITLNGENYLISRYTEPSSESTSDPTSSGVLFMTDGDNTKILVNKGTPAKQTLKGIVLADTGTIDITLNTPDTQDVYLFTYNHPDDGYHEGTMNMEVSHQATWHAMYYMSGPMSSVSQVSTLTMGDRGNVDVRHFAEKSPDNYNESPSLVIKDLKGTDGIFTIRSDIANEKAQYIQITNSSAGDHWIDVKDAGSARVDPSRPMLVVKQDPEVNASDNFRSSASSDTSAETTPSYHAHFQILKPVDVGPFTYIIGNRDEVVNAGLRGDELTDDNPDNFYLYTDGKDHQETEPTPDPAPNPKPALNPSAKGSLVRSDADFLFGLAEMQTLRQRLGDIRHFPEEDWDPWAKVIRTKYEGNDHDASVKSTMNGVQFGAHKNISRKDGKAHIGLYGSYLDSKNTYDSGRYDGKYYGIGLYGSLEEGNTYYDLVLRMGRSKGDLKTMTSGGESVTAKGHGRNQWGISLETGKRYQWEDGRFKKAARHGSEDDGFFIEPQAQLAYTRFGSFDMKTTGDLASHQDGYGILLGRIGPQVEYVKHYDSQRTLSLYGKVMMNRIFNGKPSILYNETNRVEQDFRDSYVTYGAGVNYTVKDRYEIYGEWERSCGGDWEEKYRFDLGVRYHF